METLPDAGFSYVEGSATRVSGDPNGVVRGKVDPDNDRIVTFTVVSVASFTYRVMVGSGVPDGQYPFSGDAGDSSVTVGGSAPSPGGATRSFSPEPVPAGTELTVTITGTGYGGPREIGQVMETLPDAEFTYVEGSATRVSGHPNGVVRGKVDPDNDRMVTFTVVSVASFTYRVMVGSGVPDGQYPFSGDAGDSSVTVGGSAPSPGGATRSFSPEPVPAGTELTVTITGTGYGGPREIGQVMETLPAAEFTYVEGSATRVSGHPNGVVRGTVDPDNDRMVTFTVVSVESFTYRVMVGSGVPDGQHTFSGDAGDSSVTVIRIRSLLPGLAPPVPRLTERLVSQREARHPARWLRLQPLEPTWENP